MLCCLRFHMDNVFILSGCLQATVGLYCYYNTLHSQMENIFPMVQFICHVPDRFVWDGIVLKAWDLTQLLYDLQ